MAGLGLLNRRRAIASSPVAGIPIKRYDRLYVTAGAYVKTDYYISNYDYVRVSASAAKIPCCVCGARKGMAVIVLYYNETYSYASWQTDAAVQVYVTPSSSAWRRIGMKKITASKYRGMFETEGTTGTILNDYSTAPTEVFSQVPLYVCASLLLNSDTSIDSRYFQGYFYGLQVLDSRTDELKLDLVPAMYKGKHGLYDMVGGKFYENANTEGSFTAENE